MKDYKEAYSIISELKADIIQLFSIHESLTRLKEDTSDVEYLITDKLELYNRVVSKFGDYISDYYKFN